MSKFFTLLAVILFPFYLCGMEKEEKPIPIREGISETDPEEDKNADRVMQALENNKPISEIINLLNTLNININSHVKNYLGNIYTILRCALERCNPNIEEDVALIKLILQKGATFKQQPLEGWEPYSLYALHRAIKNNNNLNIIKLLIDDYGLDINFRFANKSGWGTSALTCALRSLTLTNDADNTKCVDFLLERGADTNAYDSWGSVPLMIWTSFVKEIIMISKTKELQWLKVKPDTKLFDHGIEKLLQYGADVNQTQLVIDWDKESFIEKKTYDIIKPIFPNLDCIIKKVEAKKKAKELTALTAAKLAADLKNAAEEKKHANRSIIISGREFNLHEDIVSARCPNLCIELNPDYKKEANPQFKPLLCSPLLRNVNVYKQVALKSAASNFGTSNEQTDQEID